MADLSQLRAAFRRVQQQLAAQMFGQPDNVMDRWQELIAIARRIANAGLSSLPANGNYAGETAALDGAANALRDADRGDPGSMLAAIATARDALLDLERLLG